MFILAILLALLTIYISQRQMERLDEEKPSLGVNMAQGWVSDFSFSTKYPKS